MRQFHNQSHVVSNNQHGTLMDPAEALDNVFAARIIQSSRRFIPQEQFGIIDNAHRQHCSLIHAAA
jgi:hypothetical protein